MRKLSLEQLVEVTEAIVSENPDFIYQSPGDKCLYVHYTREEPICGCLVGHIFHELGVPLEVLADIEGRPAGRLVKMLFDVESHDVINFLDVLQPAQDYGESWSVALTAAKERVGIED